jgi:hypothetical protein
MLQWSLTAGRLAIGWGDVGNLGINRFRSADDISDVIRERYPMLKNAGRGGPSLWDLVILSTADRRRAVMRVLGDYEYVARGNVLVGDYQHQRHAEEVTIGANRLWRSAGGGPLKGQSIYRPLVRCRQDVDLSLESLSE